MGGQGGVPGQGAPYRAGQETQEEEQQVNQQMVMMVQLLCGRMKVDAGGRNDRRTGGFSQPHLSPHMTCDSVMTSQRPHPPFLRLMTSTMDGGKKPTRSIPLCVS